MSAYIHPTLLELLVIANILGLLIGAMWLVALVLGGRGRG